MLRGNNTILLNEASMCAAVQLYLNNMFSDGKAPIVSQVKPVTTGPRALEFEVGLASDDDARPV